MIKSIIDMLSLTDHYGKSELIEIAKGRYEIPKTLRQVIKQFKREWKIRK